MRLVETKRASSKSVHQILWPGYVGERYYKRGILFVGAVHNEMKLYNRSRKHPHLVSINKPLPSTFIVAMRKPPPMRSV